MFDFYKSAEHNQNQFVRHVIANNRLLLRDPKE